MYLRENNNIYSILTDEIGRPTFSYITRELHQPFYVSSLLIA